MFGLVLASHALNYQTNACIPQPKKTKKIWRFWIEVWLTSSYSPHSWALWHIQTQGVDYFVSPMKVPENNSYTIELHIFDFSGHSLYASQRASLVRTHTLNFVLNNETSMTLTHSLTLSTGVAPRNLMNAPKYSFFFTHNRWMMFRRSLVCTTSPFLDH